MLVWKDGLPYSERFGDVYYSADSGLEETRHVFLQGNRLKQRCADLVAGGSLCIGETGFGTGLNFLSAWELFERTAPSGASLDFFSVEKFPLTFTDLQAALALWPALAVPAAALLAHWQRRVPGWNRWSFAGGRVRLTLALEDVETGLSQLPACSVDAWFLDGFSPACNPDMWSDAVLLQLARTARAGATFATYTSAGWVRRGLQHAGFTVEKVPGFGRKREMLCGALASDSSIRQRCVPRSVLVIGGGIAGCATAYALAQRGVAVTLIEALPHLAGAASGNPRGILHARFGAGMHALHRIVLAAYGHALAMFDDVMPVDGVLRAECGLLQLAATQNELQRIVRLAAQDWPAHLLQAIDAETASQLAGLPLEQAGLWFPGGGWVVPPQLCMRLAAHPNISLHLGCEVTGLENTSAGWCARGADFAFEAEQTVVCNSYQARKLGNFADFPLQPVRGQVSLLNATAASEALRVVLCAEGYCAPAMDGLHLTGATSVFDDGATEVRAAEHMDNIARCAVQMPALYQALGGAAAVASGGRAGVRCSVPGATPLVGEVSKGLYCSLAHGTRGLLTAGLAAEVIAAHMCAQLPPLPQMLLEALAPVPRAQTKARAKA